MTAQDSHQPPQGKRVAAVAGQIQRGKGNARQKLYAKGGRRNNNHFQGCSKAVSQGCDMVLKTTLPRTGKDQTYFHRVSITVFILCL